MFSIGKMAELSYALIRFLIISPIERDRNTDPSSLSTRVFLIGILMSDLDKLVQLVIHY